MLISTAVNHQQVPVALSSSAKILITTDRIEDVSNIIDQCQKDDVVFIDIDDTVQAISSYLFQTSATDPLSEGGRIIDEMKKNRSESFLPFISRWRLSRRIQLVHQNWPDIIKNARDRGVLVYGFTQMDTGGCGVMSRIEEWRYNELCQLGIHFTPTFLNQQDLLLIEHHLLSESPPVFYKGIFFTGSLFENKRGLLELFLKQSSPNHITMIDDRIQQIQAAQSADIPCSFTGIVFRGVDRLVRPAVSSELYESIRILQKKNLLKGHWLENEEAMAIIDIHSESFDN